MKLSTNHAFDSLLKPKLKRPILAWALAILWLVLIGFLAFFWNLGSTGLVDETEPLFAEAARQMTVTGNWITPFFDGQTRFDKPILVYWLMAIAYEILGVNSWAVRLPSALSAMGLICLGFYTLWRFGRGLSPASSPVKIIDRRYWLAAGLGSALMALTPQTIVWARTGVSDMLLTGCMDGALLCFFLAYAQPTKSRVKTSWYIAFYVLIALAVLTKGPVGIVLPALILAAFVLYCGNAREVWREMHPVWGSFLTLVIALPWYLLVIRDNRWAYINSFFGYHNFDRFTTVLEHNSEPWYFYLLIILVGFAPWSVYLPVAIARLKFWQRQNWRSTARSQHLGIFALFWFFGVLVFFTIARTKLPSYVIPLMPAAAILVALMWNEQIRQIKATPKQPLLFWSGWLNVGLALLIAGILWYSPNLIGYDPAALNPRQIFQQSGLPILGAMIWAITAVALAVLLWYRQWWGVVSINLLGFVAFLIFVFMPVGFLIDQVRQQPLRELATLAAQVEQPNEQLIMIGFKKPSVVFYSHRPVTYISTPQSALSKIPAIITTHPQITSFLILSQPSKIQQLGLKPTEYQTLGKAGTYQLIRIAKSEF